LDELFPTSIQGVNPNRGLTGSVIEIDREVLEARMNDYYSKKTDDQLRSAHPGLFEDWAGYDPKSVRAALCSEQNFSGTKIVPYLLFPLDSRYLYYECEANLLNRPRPELWKNLSDNEFLVAVPQPRRYSETRPLLAFGAFDLHLHDRGSVGFPADVLHTVGDNEHLFEHQVPVREANLSEAVWNAVRQMWGLEGGLGGKDARTLVHSLFRTCLAICHSPQYETDHKDSLAADWAHIPLPADRALFDELSAAGEDVAVLLNPLANATTTMKRLLRSEASSLGPIKRLGGGNVGADDLILTYSYFGAARGRWRPRSNQENESASDYWGQPGDLFLNEKVYVSNVPERVWKYQLGGYPVLKKWLGYRQSKRRRDQPLSFQEAEVLRGMVQRIAALIVLHSTLDKLYDRATTAPIRSQDLGLV